MTNKNPEATKADVGTDNLENLQAARTPGQGIEGMSDGPRGQKLIKAIRYVTNASRSVRSAIKSSRVRSASLSRSRICRSGSPRK